MNKSQAKLTAFSLEERIRANREANKAVETLLANRGVDPSELWLRLDSFGFVHSLKLNAWADRCNMSRRKAAILAKRLLRDAEQVESLFTDKYLQLAVDQRSYLWLRTLPREMRFAADFIQRLLHTADDRGADAVELVIRRQFTLFVQEVFDRRVRLP